MSRRHEKADWSATDQRAQQHYLIEPRYLAGGGDLRHVTEFLRAAGWKDASPRGGGPIVFDSPDDTVRIGYDPHTQPGGWAIRGKATAENDGWYATFGRLIPVEILAGFTDALTRRRSAHAPNVWQPLELHGWGATDGPHPSAHSPDHNAFVRLNRTTSGEVHWWAGARTEHGRSWDAIFSPGTPMHLVQAFTTALADPQPVMRPRGHVPPTRRVRTTSISVLPSELAAWQQTRIAAGRATAWARNSFASHRPRSHTGVRPFVTKAGRVR